MTEQNRRDSEQAPLTINDSASLRGPSYTPFHADRGQPPGCGRFRRVPPRALVRGPRPILQEQSLHSLHPPHQVGGGLEQAVLCRAGGGRDVRRGRAAARREAHAAPLAVAALPSLVSEWPAWIDSEGTFRIAARTAPSEYRDDTPTAWRACARGRVQHRESAALPGLSGRRRFPAVGRRQLRWRAGLRRSAACRSCSS